MMPAIQLPAAIEQGLKAAAERTGHGPSEHASEAILRYLEDIEDELIALERLKQPQRRWMLDDLGRELDLER